MKYISEEYGQKCNLLELTQDEYAALEPFLLSLGVRTRTTSYWAEDGSIVCKIQAENPYKVSLIGYKGLNEITARAYEMAEREMTPFSISCYKR